MQPLWFELELMVHEVEDVAIEEDVAFLIINLEDVEIFNPLLLVKFVDILTILGYIMGAALILFHDITSVADQSFASYPDTSSSHHITLDLASLHIADEYKGKDKLIVGNGTKLHISHIGSSSINSPSIPLFLRNILHVPNIIKPLLSV